MKKLAGAFEIFSWDETPYLEGDDGVKQAEAIVKQGYSGAIVGESEVRYLITYFDAGKAVFVGFETVTGSIDGKQGSMVLQHKGQFENGVVNGDFAIVPGTAKGEWAGFEGCGSLQSKEPRQAGYLIELNGHSAR